MTKAFLHLWILWLAIMSIRCEPQWILATSVLKLFSVFWCANYLTKNYIHREPRKVILIKPFLGVLVKNNQWVSKLLG